MELSVNGEVVSLTFTTMEPNLIDLFVVLSVDTEGRFVELNGHIYEPDSFHQVKVKEGDSIEIIQFMGGGNG
ncbi:thiamine biosynthesis protein ThiS [Candidatus Marinamargulisbacteria bacterium SCGC AG-414-C22]|nr:thiamine biosynthesis protein ThiS [Candidatus Marinamargulisbacteria bacterium SCGC AG-414-C22]